MNQNRGVASRSEAGAAAVEGAVIISVLLLLVLGIIECARVLWIYNTMLIAAEQAARYAMLYNHGVRPSCAPQVQAANCPTLSNVPLANCAARYAQQVLAGYQAPNIAVSVSISSTTATVCASYSFGLIAPEMMPYGPFELTSRVTIPLI